ncbi:MAG: nucleotide exchange factor GrpE [Candidatus Thermoplasmatota archaeon]|nr:nucleotide exchange factor GrpE [Candidatus Thermoplasmatota archaeon]
MPKERSDAKMSRRPTKKQLESDLKDMQRELSGKEERIDELSSRLAYLQAELENLVKRSEKERRETRRFATEALVKHILPVVDEFDLALKSMKDRDDEFGSGVRMIYENFIKVLQSQGLQDIEAEGEAFDPYLHEAVAYVEEGGANGEIVEVLQKGYRMDERILRPSQVVVCRKEANQGG